jgi:hypothetical protein
MVDTAASAGLNPYQVDMTRSPKPASGSMASDRPSRPWPRLLVAARGNKVPRRR